MRTRRGGDFELFPSGLRAVGSTVGEGVVVEVEVAVEVASRGRDGEPATSSGPCGAPLRFVPGIIVVASVMASKERDGAEQSSKVGGTDCSATIK